MIVLQESHKEHFSLNQSGGQQHLAESGKLYIYICIAIFHHFLFFYRLNKLLIKQ